MNHAYHCIHAITIACIGRNEYDRWAQFARDEERYEWGEQARLNVSEAERLQEEVEIVKGGK